MEREGEEKWRRGAARLRWWGFKLNNFNKSMVERDSLEGEHRLGEVPDCPICFQKLSFGLAATPCGHVYHKHCIERAVGGVPGTLGSCPMCRTPTQVDTLLQLQLNIEMPDCKWRGGGLAETHSL